LSPALPGLRFRLFGFPVTIGIDFLLITFLIGYGARPGVYVLEWIAVVAVAILIHELGHAFVVRSYSINPEIRLWGMGGLTSYGFALPPRKSILISLAGPLVGIPVAVAVMVIRPWLPDADPLRTILGDLIWVCLLWGLVNLLPISGLDGGNVVESFFLWTMGERGRRPGLILVGVASIVIAAAALFVGFFYLTLVIVMFGFFNPAPYLAIWQLVSRGGAGAGAGGGAGARVAAGGGYVPAARGKWAGLGSGAGGGYGLNGGSGRLAPALRGEVSKKKQGKPAKRGNELPALAAASDARRSFGEIYADAIPGAGAELDLDELERRPEPLLADVVGMLARQDDRGLAARLAPEDDPLAVLGIVARLVEAKRVGQVLDALRHDDSAVSVPGLLRLQAGLHALGRFEDALAVASTLGTSGGGAGEVLAARSAARLGDRKRTADALERALELGYGSLSESALGDIARVGPDPRVGSVLARLRSGAAQR
jgi:stage IV sporulation protein FB